MTLRVATYNIRNGRAFDGLHSWPFRRWATAATIAELDADIVGLQEVYRFQDRYLRRRLPQYDDVWRGRSRAGRGGEGCPILFRGVRLLSSSTRWFEPAVAARFPRIATTCRFEDDDGLFDVTNVHLDAHRARNRRASAEQLVTWLDRDVPQIVLGDFNADPDDELFAALRLRHVEVEGGTAHDFTGRVDGRRIDHVLVSDDFAVLEARVVQRAGRLGSDHWPVVVDLARR
jgi:endonuclease/exonuclease/phosphatase family metal-dependent hydrolase